MKLLTNNLKQLSQTGFLTKDQYNFNTEYTLLKSQMILTRKSLRKKKQISYIYTRKYNKKNKQMKEFILTDVLSDSDLTMDDSSDDELPSEIHALQLAISRNKK